MVDEKPFSEVVRVAFGESQQIHDVGSTREAAELLMSTAWPERGERHRDATDTCMKVLEGARSTIDAERAFTEAAIEAGVLLPE